MVGLIISVNTFKQISQTPIYYQIWVLNRKYSLHTDPHLLFRVEEQLGKLTIISNLYNYPQIFF